MRIHTRTVWKINDSGSLSLLEDSFYEYSGSVELAGGKKDARKAQDQLIQTNMNNATADRTLKTSDRAAADTQAAKNEPFIQSMEKSSQGGGINDLSRAQLANDETNIAKTYDQIRESGMRQLGAAGFNRAPSGFTSSVINTNAKNEGDAQTAAYRNALQNTYNTGLQALNYRTGQQGLLMGQSNSDTSASNQENGQASDSAVKRVQMGSTLGDVVGGISSLAGVVAAPFTGGASLGLSSLASRAIKPAANRAPSGVGSFGNYANI